MEPIVIERSIVVKADRERVWWAITMPDEIAKWFEPIHFDRLAVGEALSFGWDSGGEITVVETMDRFGFSWQIAPPNPAQTLVVFELESVPEGIRITVRERGFEKLPEVVRQKHIDQNAAGWEEMLAHLQAYL
jgi:uncharacterized protein YndB with AHSA1/START domain